MNRDKSTSKKVPMKRQKSSNKNNDQSRYDGPVSIRRTDQATHLVKINDTYTVACTTSVGGVIDLVFGSSPGSLNDWAGLIATYHEFRVLAMELEYQPIKNITSWAYGIGHSVVDRETSTALGGIIAACEHDSLEKHSMFQPWKRAVRADGFEELEWLPTTGPVSYMYIKVYSDGNTTSQTIGRFYQKFLIEFRGKK